MRRLKIGDRLVRLRDEGENGKAPLLCIHGAAASSVVFMDPVRNLQNDRRVIAPDLPGHGQSDRWHPPADVTIEMYRDAIGTICANLKVEKVVLLGHSMGGLIALACAAAWPERVAGLILANTGARLKVASTIFDTIDNDFAHLPELFDRVSWSPATPKEIVSRWSGLLVSADQEIARADFSAIAAFAQFEDPTALGKLKLPTLVLAGADDQLTPPSLAKKLATAIPGAELRIFEAAGHQLPQEKPAQFLEEIRRFLVTV